VKGFLRLDMLPELIYGPSLSFCLVDTNALLFLEI